MLLLFGCGYAALGLSMTNDQVPMTNAATPA
jgi:hypothetical protein